MNGRGQTDSALTVDGVATAVRNAGTRAGGVIVRAVTWADPGGRTQPITAVLSSVTVQPGSPTEVSLGIGGEAQDAGGAMWSLPLDLRVFDRHRNPITEYLAAYEVVPDYAFATGGRLFFPSEHSLDTVEVSVVVDTPRGSMVASQTLGLPLVQGAIGANADPMAWQFQRGQGQWCNIRIWATVSDGHGVMVPHAWVHFTVSRGMLFWIDEQGLYRAFPEQTSALVRADRVIYLRAPEDVIFPDAFTTEVVGSVDAVVEGYPEVAAEPVHIWFRR